MEQEKQAMAVEETTSNNRGLSIVLGAALGYSIGRLFFGKPILGIVLGVAAALLIGSSGDEEA